MAAARRASRLLAGAAMGLGLLATTAFVAPGGVAPGGAALRGSSSLAHEHTPFAAQPAADVEEVRPVGWVNIISMAAAFGLLLGVATTPAAHAAGESTLESDSMYREGTTKKSKRRKVTEPKKEEASSSASPSAASSAPVKTVESVATPEGPKKVIISPADMEDEDEIPWYRDLFPGKYLNTPKLVLLLTAPTIVYLIFYVLGSLDII
mmetsp:Transcript_37199/g.78036  ORF Transcript_37199/g.78036 Transcript_37199/m.78036 type:complete len:208 (+) Transcript_37199:82-705(+)